MASPGASTARWALDPRALGALAPALLQLVFLLPVSKPPSPARAGGGSSGALRNWGGWSPLLPRALGCFCHHPEPIAPPPKPQPTLPSHHGPLSQAKAGSAAASKASRCALTVRRRASEPAAVGGAGSRKGSWWSAHQVPLRTVHNPTKNLGSILHSHSEMTS